MDPLSPGPGEVRWAAGGCRIGYLGNDRWRVTSSGTVEMHVSEFVRWVSSELERSPPGAVMQLPMLPPNAVARDLGEVHLVVPGRHEIVGVVLRDDLRGVLPNESGAPLDIRSVTSGGREHALSTPFGHFVHHWLLNNSERAWAPGAALPRARFGAEFSPERFEAPFDAAALAARLEQALTTRLRDSPDPSKTFTLMLRELEALGHDADWYDEDGSRWASWSSRRLYIDCVFSREHDDLEDGDPPFARLTLR